MLLTGAKGTGKSSLIKAVLNEFSGQGLRLIEVDKADLVDLPDLVELVAAPRALRHLCDDLSFDEGEASHKALKSVLDGSVNAASENVLIYATSNRRHLLPERMRRTSAARMPRPARSIPARWWRKDLAVRALWPVDQLLSVQPERVPGHRGAVVAALWAE